MEMKSEIDSLIDDDFKKRFEAEVALIGKAEGGPNGIIAFDLFFKIQAVIAKFVNEITFKNMVEHKKARRSFLSSQQEQKY